MLVIVVLCIEKMLAMALVEMVVTVILVWLWAMMCEDWYVDIFSPQQPKFGQLWLVPDFYLLFSCFLTPRSFST